MSCQLNGILDFFANAAVLVLSPKNFDTPKNLTPPQKKLAPRKFTQPKFQKVQKNTQNYPVHAGKIFVNAP